MRHASSPTVLASTRYRFCVSAPTRRLGTSAIVYTLLASLALASLLPQWAQAQSTALPALRIALLSDAPGPQSGSLDSMIYAELDALLSPRFALTVETYYDGRDGQSLDALTEAAFAKTDILVATGLTGSQHLLSLPTHPKPSIAAIVIEGLLPQRADANAEGTGIENLTWVESPFDVARDLQTLAEIKPYDRLTVLTDGLDADSRALLTDFFDTQTEADVTLVPVGPDLAETLGALPPNTDAVYALPAGPGAPVNTRRDLFEALADRGLPVFALVDQPDLALGAYGAYASGDDIAKLPRRVALDVLKITDGRPASELRTDLSASAAQLIINMAAARRSGVYPDFELLAGAAITNLNAVPTADTLSLEAAIIEGLASNLGLRASGYDVVVAGADAGLAKANLYPQLNAGTAFTMIDGATAAASFGQQGQYNWTAQATATQVVLS